MLSSAVNSPDGIWLPFTDPASISNVQDYCIQMSSSIPQTYNNAPTILQQAASSGDKRAQSIRNTEVRDENGSYILQFQSSPWLHGANWLINNNPLVRTLLSSRHFLLILASSTYFLFLKKFALVCNLSLPLDSYAVTGFPANASRMVLSLP